MLVLGIESTCDEAAASVVQDGRHILSQVVSSQIDLHNVYGGVVPELACRRHMEVMLPVIHQALEIAGKTLEEIDLIAVAYGPGLIGPLFVGIHTAKGLALASNKPIVGVNHVEAHLYAAWMSTDLNVEWPAIGVVLSGGHTSLLKINHIGSYQLLGQTVDDAIGEAFDKVAKLLGLPYPGGPLVESLAKGGNPHRFKFKAGTCKGQPLNFSFSGLKTAVLYALQKADKSDPALHADLCASFQSTAFNDILVKTVKAAEETGASTVLFGGGVTNNQMIKELFKTKAPHLECIWPKAALTMDNASMIAGLGYHVYMHGGAHDLAALDAATRIPFKS